MDIHIANSSISERKSPTPKTPAPINKASEIEHTKQAAKTCERNNPCLITKTFCGPRARISDILIRKPEIKANSKIFSLIPQTHQNPWAPIFPVRFWGL